MRHVMANAKVGDEQQFLDPSVNLLCEMVADLTGKEAAVFLPSGTMCNQISFKVHCRPGDEIILDYTAHPVNAEAGGPSSISMAQTRTLHTHRGIFTANQVSEAIRPLRRYEPESRVLSVENTTGFGGGCIWPIKQVAEVCSVAHDAGMFTHMDGARLMNAVVESKTSASTYGKHFDSLWIDLSKGLGCPIGAVLTGSKKFIDQAWRYKQQMGGAMRQAGIVAAAGIYALEQNIERLSIDHNNARIFCDLISNIPGVRLTFDSCETNIVFFDVQDTPFSATEVSKGLLESGIYIGTFGQYGMRAVTHLGIEQADIEEAAETLSEFIRR